MVLFIEFLDNIDKFHIEFKFLKGHFWSSQGNPRQPWFVTISFWGFTVRLMVFLWKARCESAEVTISSSKRVTSTLITKHVLFSGSVLRRFCYPQLTYSGIEPPSLVLKDYCLVAGMQMIDYPCKSMSTQLTQD